MIGLDTSFLVALCVREHAAHGAAEALLEGEIAGRPGGCALAPQVLTEFVHVVTDPKRFAKPLEMRTALDLCDQWWEAEEVRAVSPDDEAGRLFTGWMRQHRLGRKRILDTFLAATYFAAGIRNIVTTDWRDFSTFGVFAVRRIE
ncbi:MAG: type II toxin-antitoxin system VapC family toxin [Opitutaceae bacterium]